MDVQVLGTGCANCKQTIALIEKVARERGAAITLEKVQDMRDIVGYGVMATPGVLSTPWRMISGRLSTFSTVIATPFSLATASMRATVVRQLAQPVPRTLMLCMGFPFLGSIFISRGWCGRGVTTAS